MKRYPKLELFTGWGIFAQNFEGQILKDVMLQGVEENVVVLPVHDAVAIQTDSVHWAVSAMQETWSRKVGANVSIPVKIDYASS